MTVTAWNPSDKTSALALSNLNLTATTSASSQGVRGVDRQTAGKFYFEVTLTTLASSSAVGVGTSAANLANLTGPTSGAAVLEGSGVIYVDTTNTGISLGVRSNGNVIGIAVDITNALIWFRIAPSGNWNNNAGFAPGGTGGISLTALGAVPLYPLAGLFSWPGAFTANFGATAFSGAVPAGFTSGWLAGAPVDLAGNLGGSSQYGELLYGKGLFSRIAAFAPIFVGDLTVPNPITFTGNLAPAVSFAADLDVHVNIIDLAGGITPQIVLGGPLTVLSLGLVFDGSLSFTPVLGASSFVSGPLWADIEPCPPPAWVDSELCPPSLWTPVPPPQWQTPDAPGSYGLNAYGVGRYNPPSDAPWSETELCDGG